MQYWGNIRKNTNEVIDVIKYLLEIGLNRIARASNVTSVLLNKDVVKGVGIGVNKKKKPTRIAAILNDKNETETIMKVLQAGFRYDRFGACNYDSSPMTGITGDKEKGVVTIDRDGLQDKGAFDLVLGTLITAAELASK